ALYYLARGSGGQVFRISALPAHALNISGRARVEIGEGVAISGFIITGTGPKRVGVRGIGPSLANFGVSGPLADPVIQLSRADGSLVMANDNWKNTQQAEITGAGLAPSNDKEAALIATLTAGNYTAIVTGKNGGTGVAQQPRIRDRDQSGARSIHRDRYRQEQPDRYRFDRDLRRTMIALACPQVSTFRVACLLGSQITALLSAALGRKSAREMYRR